MPRKRISNAGVKAASKKPTPTTPNSNGNKANARSSTPKKNASTNDARAKKKTPTKEAASPAVITQTPPHNVRVYNNRKVVHVKVTLHRIPEKLVEVDVTDTRFHMDCLKYSKKFLLDIPFPDGIEVVSDQAEASLQFGILTVTIPLKSVDGEMVYEATPKHKKGKSSRQAAKVAAAKKKKEAAAAARKSKGETAQKGKKRRKAKKNEEESSKYLTQTSTALEIVENVNKSQDQTRIKSLKTSEANVKRWDDRDLAREDARNRRLEKKGELRKRAIDSLEQRNQRKKQAVKVEKKKNRKSVSFTDI